MALVDDTQRSELLAKAQEAITAPDSGVSHEIYRDIVQTLTRLCNKNQKEIAAELQVLAKKLEDDGKVTEAFEFKQRTCAVMLELSMEERRRNRVHGQSGSAPALTSFAPAVPTAPAARPVIGAPSASSSSSSDSSLPRGSNDFSPGGKQTPHTVIEGTTAAPSPAMTSGTNSSASKQASGSTTSSSSGGTAGIHSSTTSDTITLLQASANAIDAALPFLSIDYLYMGSNDYERDLIYYRDVLGAQEVWNFDRFGSRITAFSLCAGPLLLLADHRTAPACQPVFRVADLSATARDLKQRGWQSSAGPFGTPNGEAYSFKDPSGNTFALYQIDETSTDKAYYDPTDSD